ncbi:MAG: thioredoxin family protein [Dehalococcoidales bacterium]|nr:thioredoxin family protein [Dehalococcoidales bacterium]
MNIKILGPGCAKCHKLEETVAEVIKEMGLDIKVEKVSDMKKIMQYPILMTPGLVINDKLVVSGKVPSKAEVTKHITTALARK